MKPVLARLNASLEDLPPERVALVVTIGLALGVFPIWGLPTVFCLLAAALLRGSVAPLQILNNLSSPLQLALLVPLERAGARLFGTPAGLPAAGRIGMAARHAVAGWACICVPGAVLFYFALLFAIRRGVTVVSSVRASAVAGSAPSGS